MRRFFLTDTAEFMRRYGRFAILGLMLLTIAVAGADCNFEPECEAFC